MRAESVRIRWSKSWARFSPMQRRLYGFCYVTLVPVLALFAYIRLVPIARTMILSLYNWNLASVHRPFIGFANYVRLAADENFIVALENTTLYSVSTVVFSTLLALPLAVFLAGRSRLAPIYQTIYFLPVITPMVPMAVAWKWIYDPNYGILNYGLALFHVPPVGWLVNPQIALWALIIMSVWKVLGYNLILFLVGIRNIPAMYFESSSLDGASGWQQFWFITLPLLKPIVLYVLVTATINAYNVFTQVYVMTLGSQVAPGRAVRVLIYDIYENGFRYFRMGYASAEAVILTLIVLGLTLMQFTLIRGEEG